MPRAIALVAAVVVIIVFAAPPSAALAQQRAIAIAIPAQFPIKFPAGSLSACWRVARPADGRITATVTGPGTWNVCIGDASCPSGCAGPLRSASTEQHTQGSSYFVKVETETPGVTATLAIFPTGGAPPNVAGDVLGARWDVSESGWTGSWVRRGSSNIFDATWQKGGDTGSSVLTMSLTGNRVHIERRDASNWGGAYVVYDGTIAADGTVTGTGTVPATGVTMSFRATIRSGTAPTPAAVAPPSATAVIRLNDDMRLGSSGGFSSPAPGPPATRTSPPGRSTAACGLGARWDVSESGWTGSWVRRGSSNIFDATWSKGGAVFSSVLTMTPNGNQVHIERRDAASGGGAYVVYDVTIAADGTVTGTGAVPATGATMSFRATVHCGAAD